MGLSSSTYSNTLPQLVPLLELSATLLVPVWLRFVRRSRNPLVLLAALLAVLAGEPPLLRSPLPLLFPPAGRPLPVLLPLSFQLALALLLLGRPLAIMLLLLLLLLSNPPATDLLLDGVSVTQVSPHSYSGRKERATRS